MNEHPEKARKGSREGFPEIFFPLELGHFLHLAGRKKKRDFWMIGIGEGGEQIFRDMMSN